jgi:hypothetical protein
MEIRSKVISYVIHTETQRSKNKKDLQDQLEEMEKIWKKYWNYNW